MNNFALNPCYQANTFSFTPPTGVNNFTLNPCYQAQEQKKEIGREESRKRKRRGAKGLEEKNFSAKK